jgi:dTDP-4-amino-4,6-dideoxygalactose transaminase
LSDLKEISPLPFIDLEAQQRRIRPLIDAALNRVLDHGHYIMGPEIEACEASLSQFCGAKHVLSCSNGTDALVLALMAQRVQPGDVVFVPTFTYVATAEAVVLAGGIPLFVDVLKDSYNMDPVSLKRGIQRAKALGLKPRGVIVVDLFGQPADYEALLAIAEADHLWVICDAAQSFGAQIQGKKVGTFGTLTTTSFFPAKPLGCYGDAGAVFTDDEGLYATLKSLRVHGQGTSKYDAVRIGMNGRMDTLQAAILLEKLKIFPEEIRARQEVSERYAIAFSGLPLDTPCLSPSATSVWAQYTVQLKENVREALSAFLAEKGIPTVVYYIKSLHQQKAYDTYPCAEENRCLPVSEALSKSVLSFPMHAYIPLETVDRIGALCHDFFKENRAAV